MTKKHDFAKLYQTQKSLSEWLEDIKHERVAELRHEDNEKRERLRELNLIIGLPYDKQVQFAARDIADNTPAHQKYISEHGNELCALRLIPRDKSLPKLRMRGLSVEKVQEWFANQDIDPDMYRAEYIPHSDNQTWSTIFVVNEEGIFGEIIKGSHAQLTQGFYDDDHWPHTFSYDFKNWQIEPYDLDAQNELEKIVQHLCASASQQTAVKDKLDGDFTRGYLKGYFETVESTDYGLWFVDYAPELGELIGHISSPISAKKDNIVSGQVGCAGRAEGQVRIVDKNGEDNDFPEGAVLVCSVTTPDLVPLMQRACAIVTDNGGILSHAAIVARELKIPCIVGTKIATQLLRDGQMVVVDANAGTVELKST